jgi:phosphomannomutase
MITASHNPPQYNGIKVFDGAGMAYGEEEQNQIESLVRLRNFQLAEWHSLGEVQELDEAAITLKWFWKT